MFGAFRYLSKVTLVTAFDCFQLLILNRDSGVPKVSLKIRLPDLDPLFSNGRPFIEPQNLFR